ncbi:MAG: TRZ/ATZ family hydrolase [Pseudomonadota bacterium]
MHPTVDLLIQARYVLPIEPRGVTYENAALAILEGRIVGIVQEPDIALWRATKTVTLPNHVLLPGLVNAHGHAAMTLFRGFADDHPLQHWLENHIWPAEAAHVGEDFVRDGTRLAIAEMLLGGTTCFSDMYLFPEVVAALCRDYGIRCQLCSPIIDFPSGWAAGPDEYLSKALALQDELKSHSLLTVVFGPHSTYSVGPDVLERIAVYAAELDMGVQIHVHETAREVADSVDQFGRRPLGRLFDMGLLGPKTQCVHMAHIDEADEELLLKSGAGIVHCPESNMKLASGACPAAKLMNQGVPLGLGTDGAASNNDLNMFGEMRSAAFLAKHQLNDAKRLPALDALRMATLGSARVMGLDEQIGSLEVGKQADVIALDLSAPHTQPIYNLPSQIAYACNGSEVSDVWVAGQQVVRSGAHMRLDLSECLECAADWARTIAAGARGRPI